MSIKMKKIICALLSCAMLTAGMGITFADDEATDTAAETTATETTETTDEAETTDSTDADTTTDDTTTDDTTTDTTTDDTAADETTDTTSDTTTDDESSYASDSYYNEAITLVSALGIITGYEDGMIHPDDKVTREQMAAIILRLKAASESSAYASVFTDVDSERWSAAAIQTAYDAGIINGYGDGTFGPADDVTYEQVTKMIVCAHNRATDAENLGGYPNGYITAASNLLSLDYNVSGTVGEAADRGLVAKMIYNALLADYAQPDGTDTYGNPSYAVKTHTITYKDEDGNSQTSTRNSSLAYVIFSVESSEAVIMGTPTSSLTGDDIQDGRMAIKDTTVSNAEVETVYADDEGFDDMLGYKVKYFYKQTVTDVDKTVIAMIPSKNTTVYEVNVEDVVDDGWNVTASSPYIRYYTDDSSKKTLNIDADEFIAVYNGQVLSDDEYSTYLDDEFEAGTVKLIDNDGDNKYEVCIFKDSFTGIIVSATSSKVNYKRYLDGSLQTLSLDVDEDSKVDKTITVTKEGEAVKPRNLKKNDVAVITVSPDESIMDIVVTGESMEGTITTVSTEDDDTYVRIDGTSYKVAAVCVEECGISTSNGSGVFYFDSLGNIGYIDYTSSSGKLNGSEQYGWIAKIYEDEETENPVARIYSVSDQNLIDYTLASKVTYWGPGDTEASTVSATSLYDIDFASIGKNSEGFKLCKYTANSKGEINKLYVATAKTSTNDEAVTYSAVVDSGTGNGTIYAGTYVMSGSIIELTVPADPDDNNTLSAYKVAELDSSKYLTREGNGIYAVMAEVDSKSVPNVVVRYTDSSSSRNTDMEVDGFTSSSNATLVVSSIDQGVNDDDDVMYIIKGYCNGNEVTYQTSATTSLYITTTSTICSGQRQYTSAYGSKGFVWSPISGSDPYDFTDYCQKGDVFVLAVSGSTIGSMLKVVDVDQVATEDEDSDTGFTPAVVWQKDATATSGWDSYNVESREGWAWGQVTNVEVDESVSVMLGTMLISIDSSKTLSVVEIDANGRVTVKSESVTADDLTADGSDYVLAKTYRNAVQEVYVYRFI